MRGIVFIISAPSGTGKTSLVRTLVAQDSNLVISISHTTRAPRPGETNDIHYHFVSNENFEMLQQSGAFLEHATVYGHAYGTSLEGVENHLANGKDVILEIDWQGAQSIRAKLPAVGIYILPPSREVLAERLTHRKQDQAAVIDKRMKQASQEMAHFHEYEYVVINDEFETALSDIQSIIHAARLTRERQEVRYHTLIKGLVDAPLPRP